MKFLCAKNYKNHHMCKPEPGFLRNSLQGRTRSWIETTQLISRSLKDLAWFLKSLDFVTKDFCSAKNSI